MNNASHLQSLITQLQVVIILVALATAISACDGFVLGSAEEGDTVIIRLSMESPQTPHTASDTDYTITGIELAFKAIDITKENEKSYAFVLPDTTVSLSPGNNDLKMSEKIIPAGSYRQLDIEIGSLASPGNTKGTTDPENVNNLSNVETKGNYADLSPGGKDFRDKRTQAEPSGSYSGSRSQRPKLSAGREGSLAEQSFSVRLTGEYMGKPFTYNYADPFSSTFELVPPVNVGIRTDTVSVIRMMVDYTRMLLSSGNDQILDPGDESNREQINKNIRESIILKWGKTGNPGNQKQELPGLTVSDIENPESQGLIFHLSLTGSSTYTIAVDYETRDLTATSNQDFQPVEGSLMFAPGEREKQIPVSVIDDDIYEDNEELQLVLTNPVNVILDRTRAKGSILDDDGFPQIAIGDGESVENESAVVFDVSLTHTGDREISVHYRTKDGTAKNGTDFKSVEGIVKFEPGTVLKEIRVPLIDDRINESTESFSLELSNPEQAQMADSVGRGTITDDDKVTMSIRDARGREEEGSLAFTVELDTRSDRQISADYSTRDGTATASEDYESTRNRLIFSPGELSRRISITVYDDQEVEPDEETFQVSLSNPLNTELGRALATGTIIDNDVKSGPPADVRITGEDAEAEEGDGELEFTIRLSEAAEEEVTVEYATVDLSAAAGEDYRPVTGKLAFSPGQTVKTIPVVILDDDIEEDQEQFGFRLANPQNAVISREVIHGIIIDDDTTSGDDGDNGKSKAINPNRIHLTAVCTTPEGKARFRIKNENKVEVEVTYDIKDLPNSAEMVTVAGKGEVFVYVPRNSTVRLYYEGKQIDVKTSNPGRCKPQ